MILQPLDSGMCQNGDVLIITNMNRSHYLSTDVNNQLKMKKAGDGVTPNELFKFRVLDPDNQGVFKIFNYKNRRVGIHRRNGSLILQVITLR